MYIQLTGEQLASMKVSVFPSVPTPTCGINLIRLFHQIIRYWSKNIKVA